MSSLMGGINLKFLSCSGHILSEEGIIVGPEKIEAIRGWPTPKNVAEVRSFMELTGYYKRFIEGFSNIAHPITS
jgi:hypothetical protein